MERSSHTEDHAVRPTAPRVRVILASTSRYRARLLRRLLPHFEQRAPAVTEALLADEAPAARARRLAVLKARAVAAAAGSAIVIGSDQVASLGARILHKPGDAANAERQLALSAGRAVRFATAVCVIDTRPGATPQQVALDVTTVHMRALQAAEISRYVAREQPFDCAGSFKCEGLGSSLFEALETSDPSALIGLPLIALAHMLRRCGLNLP